MILRRVPPLFLFMLLAFSILPGCNPPAVGGQFGGRADLSAADSARLASAQPAPGVSNPLPSPTLLSGNMRQPTLNLGLPSPTPPATPTPAFPTAAVKPTQIPSPLPTQTATPVPPSVPIAYSEKFDIGKSSQGRPLTVSRLGGGDAPVMVIAGAIHGNEPNTAFMVEALDSAFYDMRAALPPVTLYFLARINPDGIYRAERFNANKVNLNRNFLTSNWQPDVVEAKNAEPRKGGGGPSPFSEPETAALSKWLLDLRAASPRPVVVIFYHAAFPPTGYVQPAYQSMYKGHESDPRSAAVARLFEQALGYRYYSLWPEFLVTGEAINWCGDHQLVCVDLELPDFSNPTPAQVQAHARVLLEILRRWPD